MEISILSNKAIFDREKRITKNFKFKIPVTMPKSHFFIIFYMKINQSINQNSHYWKKIVDYVILKYWFILDFEKRNTGFYFLFVQILENIPILAHIDTPLTYRLRLFILGLFRCVQHLYKRVCPSVRRSIRPSVGPTLRP